jgi:hypothetical protein
MCFPPLRKNCARERIVRAPNDASPACRERICQCRSTPETVAPTMHHLSPGRPRPGDQFCSPRRPDMRFAPVSRTSQEAEGTPPQEKESLIIEVPTNIHGGMDAFCKPCLCITCVSGGCAACVSGGCASCHSSCSFCNALIGEAQPALAPALPAASLRLGPGSGAASAQKGSLRAKSSTPTRFEALLSSPPKHRPRTPSCPGATVDGDFAVPGPGCPRCIADTRCTTVTDVPRPESSHPTKRPNGRWFGVDAALVWDRRQAGPLAHNPSRLGSTGTIALRAC